MKRYNRHEELQALYLAGDLMAECLVQPAADTLPKKNKPCDDQAAEARIQPIDLGGLP